MTNFSNLIRRSAATVATGVLIGTAFTSGLPTTADAAPAQSTIGVVGTTLEIRLDGLGQPSVGASITSTPTGRLLNVFRFNDNGLDVAPQAGKGCRATGAPLFEVTCTGYDRILVSGNADGNLVALWAALHPMTVNGGGGHDTIVGGNKADSLRGDTGDDEIHGMGGADDLQGGAGYDEVGYEVQYGLLGEVSPVTVIVDGVAGDGAAGENDFVRPDVEVLSGAAGDDRLSFAPTTSVHGLPTLPTDTLPVTRAIEGRGGNDILLGGSGSDVLIGEGGQDQLDGRSGRDLAVGGADVDACVAESEQDCEI